MTASIPNTSAIAMCDDAVDPADSGSTNPNAKLRIYSGSVPSLCDDGPGAGTLLAELDMSNPAFGNAADAGPGATATAAAISDDTDADDTGTASFFFIVDRDENEVLLGEVGATGSGKELELNSTAIQAGAKVEVTSLTVTMPEG